MTHDALALIERTAACHLRDRGPARAVGRRGPPHDHAPSAPVPQRLFRFGQPSEVHPRLPSRASRKTRDAGEDGDVAAVPTLEDARAEALAAWTRYNPRLGAVLFAHGREWFAPFYLILLVELYNCAVSTVAALYSDSNMMDLNRTLFTPESDTLPTGTYLPTGLSVVAQLAEYLDGHPDVVITRLLISDSSLYAVLEELAWEMAEGDYPIGTSQLTYEEEERAEDIRHHNAKITLKLKRAVRDLEAPLKRVLDKAAPSLQALTYLTYIPPPASRSYDAFGGGPFLRSEGRVSALKRLPTRHYDRGDIQEHNNPRITALLSRNYPALRRLSIVNRHIDGASPVLKNHHRFPSIAHLRLDHHYDNSPTLSSLLAKFPELTHLMLTCVSSMDELPPEINTFYPIRGWWERYTANALGIHRKPPPMNIPGNLTVIVQPGFSPMLGDVGFCATPGEAYDEMLERLTDEPSPSRVHAKLLTEQDYHCHGHGSTHLRRAVAEFEDRANGGDGQWGIPARKPNHADWWDRRFNSPKLDEDESEL
ncbi:hypothetical protein FB451DRAFT_1563376 [Mycena latifolia]|nr:hypothetical protein FB451DRAFT_1563376 [Mycena latifolia]